MTYQDEVIQEIRRIIGDLRALEADLDAHVDQTKCGCPTIGAIHFAIWQLKDGVKFTHYFR